MNQNGNIESVFEALLWKFGRLSHQNGEYILENGEKLSLTTQEIDLITIEYKAEKKKNIVYDIFANIAFQLKKIAIGKDGSREYIERQLEVYETMYKNALDGLYSEAENKAIIAANKDSRAKIARALKTMNDLRNLLVAKVEAGEDIDKYIEFLQDIELTEESIEDERIDAFLDSFHKI